MFEEEKHQRRDVLRAGAGLASALSMGGMAGCTSFSNFLGDGSGGYSQWLPAPGELTDDLNHYWF
ncbi:MAG: hypothetical protein ABEI52_03325, partial [Halobacteriaceae archaeon]